MQPNNPKDLFKSWVPEWLVKIILFTILMPSMVLFFLPQANLNASAGHYGCEPKDMQFAVTLFYAGFVGFYSLERRFFSFLATKEYFIIFNILQIISCVILYNSMELYVIFPLRFLQGMLFASSVNLSLSTIFTRIESEKAREISFSVFFGMLICTTPFNNIVTADLIDQFDYNFLYKIAVFSFMPGLMMILLSMNYVRLQVKFPLYDLDWESFVLYSTILILFGYLMAYGQQYYWFEDTDLRIVGIGLLIFIFFFAYRQFNLKRPYINLQIFKFRNFKIGCLVLFIMYICRFASGITNNYFGQILKFDPRHISYINIFNLAGLIFGVVISCAFLLQKRNIRFIWGTGFLLLLIFHVAMYFLFNVSANESYYFLPLLCQGIGVGMIMVPTIIYIISSVDIKLGPSAAAIALCVRYLGFTVSMGLINYFSLFRKSQHYNRFQDNITYANTVYHDEINRYMNKLSTNGMLPSLTEKAGQKLVIADVNQQASLRYAMDYYEMMSWIILGMIVLVICTPYINKTLVYLKSKTLVPA
ncbi:beta-carotene 15,15'-monooxygenase [Paenimyroides tangerinum]|uniref:Beta-carotene 15,15'-monooxygenase n=1 Tax=Paenimyroides tangerinum TaxID=2488728 RepID=A0A3P3WAK5_9FLAO|nr:beta-carotene 15,15'-monooxygenase [Paenimyroides tangerinum]RRJ90996.1 beta-carotene 15,15'-monooxygenase [Paenimyroides tangerinum]